MNKTEEKVKQGSGPENAVKENVQETVAEPVAVPADGRYTRTQALERWEKKFSLDRSQRHFEPKELREIDIYAKDTPTSDEYPNGMWGQLVIIGANTKRPEDKSLNVAFLASDEYRDKEGTSHRIDHTSRTIKFRNGVLDLAHSQSLNVLRFLLQSKDYGREYIVEANDFGGIWRFFGLVEEERVTITKLTTKAM